MLPTDVLVHEKHLLNVCQTLGIRLRDTNSIKSNSPNGMYFYYTFALVEQPFYSTPNPTSEDFVLDGSDFITYLEMCFLENISIRKSKVYSLPLHIQQFVLLVGVKP